MSEYNIAESITQYLLENKCGGTVDSRKSIEFFKIEYLKLLDLHQIILTDRRDGYAGEKETIMENVIKVRVKPEKKKTQEGREFIAYKGFTKNGAIVDIKFRSEIPAADLPKEECVVVVEDTKMNRDKRKAYPTFWISEIIEIRPLEAIIDVEANRKEMHEVFG